MQRPHCLVTMWGREYYRTDSGRLYLEVSLFLPVRVTWRGGTDGLSSSPHGSPRYESTSSMTRVINKEEAELVGQEEGVD